MGRAVGPRNPVDAKVGVVGTIAKVTAVHPSARGGGGVGKEGRQDALVHPVPYARALGTRHVAEHVPGGGGRKSGGGWSGWKVNVGEGYGFGDAREKNCDILCTCVWRSSAT